VDLLERLERFAPDEAQPARWEPGLDERLARGVAVAAAAGRDAVLGEALGAVGNSNVTSRPRQCRPTLKTT
jgi:hypothetical protein